MGFSGQFSVEVGVDGRIFAPLVFTYVDGIWLSPNSVISTDQLGRYSQHNYEAVKKIQRCNGCVEAHNEGNTAIISDLRRRNIEQVRINRIYPTYL